ncbi:MULTISPECIES: hypothetical protein [Nocardioides]|uniref:Uncharacterized protein n=1 Tax=Nocardioides vastitatis TaxID=2568655 RepID=A0ABW0ZJ55_9ACTN|nr:hypothetical protein [Nocardioides sp.]THJ06710.1 hypothetical protein E7Z54_05900 [Nocardioides sp.]
MARSVRPGPDLVIAVRAVGGCAAALAPGLRDYVKDYDDETDLTFSTFTSDSGLRASEVAYVDADELPAYEIARQSVRIA